MDENIVDALLQRFHDATQAGYVTIGNATLSILWMLAGIAMVVAIVWNMWGGRTPWGALFTKVVMIWFFAWVVESWPTITDQIQNTFIQIGMMAGDGGMSAEDFRRPSMVTDYGEEVAAVFFRAADEVTFAFSVRSGFSGSLVEWFGYWMAGWVVTLSYWLAGVLIFASQILFYLSSLVALFMVAFMVLGSTAWMGRSALGYLVSSGVMLAALAAVCSISMPIFQSIAFDTVNETAVNQAALGSLVLLFSILSSAVIARGVGSGVASWGMGGVMETAAMGAAATGVAAAGVKALGSGAASRASMSQMSRAGVPGAVGSGGGITMNSPTSFMKGSHLGGGGAKGASPAGTTAAGRGKASPPVPAGGSNRGERQLRDTGRLPSPTSAAMVARAAMPQVADDGPSMTADHR